MTEDVVRHQSVYSCLKVIGNHIIDEQRNGQHDLSPNQQVAWLSLITMPASVRGLQYETYWAYILSFSDIHEQNSALKQQKKSKSVHSDFMQYP